MEGVVMIVLAVVVLVTLAGVVGIGVAVRRSFLIATVRGNSMAPALRDGESVKIRRQRGEVCRRGDVVLFAVGEEHHVGGDPRWRIKRVAAIAGDPAPDWMPGSDTSRKACVPPGHIAICGDNPASETSRELGYISHGVVVGVVIPTRAAGSAAVSPAP
jgi:signal peptidase I